MYFFVLSRIKVYLFLMKKIKPMNFKGAKNASQFYHRVQIKLKCLSFALKPEHFSPNDVYFCQMGNILATR